MSRAGSHATVLVPWASGGPKVNVLEPPVAGRAQFRIPETLRLFAGWRRPFILGLRLWNSGQASREPLAGAGGAYIPLFRMYAVGMPVARKVRPSPPHPESGSKAPKQQSGSRASALQKSRRPSVKAHGANRVPWLLRSFVRQPCLPAAAGLQLACGKQAGK